MLTMRVVEQLICIICVWAQNAEDEYSLVSGGTYNEADESGNAVNQI